MTVPSSQSQVDADKEQPEAEAAMENGPLSASTAGQTDQLFNSDILSLVSGSVASQPAFPAQGETVYHARF